LGVLPAEKVPPCALAYSTEEWRWLALFGLRPLIRAGALPGIHVRESLCDYEARLPRKEEVVQRFRLCGSARKGSW
jgi:hypothetical protein